MIGPEENIALLIANWRLMVGRLPGHTMQCADGVASLFANVPLPFLNFSILDGYQAEPETFRRSMHTVTLHAEACGHPTFLALSAALSPSNWAELAAQAGWFPAMNLTAMDAEELLPPRRPLPELEFRRTDTIRVSTELAVINAHAYGLPLDLFACLFNLDLWQDGSFGFTGSFDGEAITAAAIFPVDGTAYAAFVATLPGHQGNGYAEAALRHAIAWDAASSGRRRITMHATDLGRPLYLGMGFVPGDAAVLLTRHHP